MNLSIAGIGISRLTLLTLYMSFSCWLFAGDQYVATADLNIRTGPSANKPSINVIKKGDHLTVIDSSNSFWFKIVYGGDTGFVAKTYLIPLADPKPESVVVPSSKPQNVDRELKQSMRTGFIVCCGIALTIFAWAISRNKKRKTMSPARPATINPVSQQKVNSPLQSNAQSSGLTADKKISNIPSSVQVKTSEGIVEVPIPKFKVSVTVNNKQYDVKDDSIVDVTGKGSVIPTQQIPGMIKYAAGVPHWSHQYIYTVQELRNASPEQKEFYGIFKKAFLEGTYYDVEGNSNYPFTLLFDLEEDFKAHNNIDLLQRQYIALGKYYPKTASYTLDIVIQCYQRLGANESAQALRQQQRTYTNSSYDYQADYWGFGTRSKKKYNLSDDQVKILNKLIDTTNNFNSIEYVTKHLIYSLFDSIENLNKHFSSCGTTFDEQIGKIADVELTKHYKFRKGSRNYKEQFQAFTSTVHQCIFKTIENKFREMFFIGRKTELIWYIRSAEALELFYATFSDPLDRIIAVYMKQIEEPDDQTEEELNAYSKARWKNKLEGIKLGVTEHQKFYEAVQKLGLQNSKNPAVENIFFEAAKHVAKIDKVTALKLYVHYVEHDLKSVTFDNKQLTKTIQKSLFQNTEQSAEFESIIASLISTKNVRSALTDVEKIYLAKRKKIVLDKNKIKEVQDQHSETVELLNEYLQDEEQTPQPIPAIESEVSQANQSADVSIFDQQLNLNEIEIGLLVLISKSGYTIPSAELDVFAKSNEVFRNSLIQGVNEKCYEILDDVLIEESDDTYTINESYYEKLLAK